MARVNGLKGISGNIGELTFYMDANGQQRARKKIEGPIKQSERTKLSSIEFGIGSTAARDLRKGFSLHSHSLSDGTVSARFSGALRLVTFFGQGLEGGRKLDLSSNGSHLIGTEFRKYQPLVYSLGGLKELPRFHKSRNGVLWHLGNINSLTQITGPEKATHFALQMNVAAMSNYVYNDKQKKYVPLCKEVIGIGGFMQGEILPLNLESIEIRPMEIILPISQLPKEAGLVVAVGITFFKEVNTEMLPIPKSGGMRIVGVF